MVIREKTLKILSTKKKLTTRDVVLECGVSRQYANSVIRKLIKEGLVVKIGSTSSVFYVRPERAKLLDIKVEKKFRNEKLEESEVFDIINKQLFPVSKIPDNVANIFWYVFTEMFNNAMEHSESKIINVAAERNRKNISFTIDDFGIGVFNNIMKKGQLSSELEAIQDLLKGKTTTQPRGHTGQGIFFSSKAVDLFILESFGYRLRVDNILNDVFIERSRPLKKGTKVSCVINRSSEKNMEDVYLKHQAGPFEIGFNKTEIKVRLFAMGGTIYISRSQAKRILIGLDKFKSIVFDFEKVSTVGQAFADEIFRVFPQKHPEIMIQAINTSETVQFMIDRVEKNNVEIEKRTGKLFDLGDK